LEEARVPVDVEAIKELIRIVDQSDIAELKWENKDSRIILRKAAALAKGGAPAAPVTPPAAVAVGGGGPEDAAQAVVATSAAGPGAAATGTAGSTAAADAAVEDGATGELVSVTAPMVGTFYRAPAPDADPYVKEGDLVDVGDPLCIIEAMKLMNEIESEVRGRIRDILVENGQPVEYGQVLFIIEKV